MAKSRDFADIINKIDWEKLIAAAEKFMALCAVAGATPAEQEKQLRKPDLKWRRKAEKLVKADLGLSTTEWRKNKKAIMQHVWSKAAHAPKKQVNEMIARARTRAEVDVTLD